MSDNPSLTFYFLDEPQPGVKWEAFYQRMLPAYQRWYFASTGLPRPNYRTCNQQFKKYFPELIPFYETMLKLAGDTDFAARLLSFYTPPPYLTACSQVVCLNENPALLRNYDYVPHLFEGVIWKTNWLQPVIYVSDCLWGALDGINASGLCLSLAFGGSKAIGKGFGIPIILRYVLETCSTTQQAIEILSKIPTHMAYNITIIDAHNQYVTLFLHPNNKIVITKNQIATNHQQTIEWEKYNDLTQSTQRFDTLQHTLNKSTPNTLLKALLKPPLFVSNKNKNYFTLYTSVYYPQKQEAHYHWLNKQISLSFNDFKEAEIPINL